MDEVWSQLKCDPNVMDHRVSSFYSHPVWLLNGLFIEQHAESLNNRQVFSDWVVKMSPSRIADYGGGFGSLARRLGEALPEATIEIVEPHPHPAAIALAEKTKNVSYIAELSGKYDILIATDVFEHVPDPLGLAMQSAEFLKPDGRYLIANCFWPVMKCHLPQTFHFRYSWNHVLLTLGLVPNCAVCYGQVYIRSGRLELNRARVIEERSRQWFPWLKQLPESVRRRVLRLFWRAMR